MLGALLYLRLVSAGNWLRSRARRLRQPKYLVGAVVGCAYFYTFFFRPMGQAGVPRSARPGAGLPPEAIAAARAALPADWAPVTTAFGALALLALFAVPWLVPRRRAALGFTEAEIVFLFPAPVSRQALVHFRLLSGQLRSLVGATVMTLFSQRWAMLGGNALTHALGWWVIFSTLNLHFSGANFVLSRLIDAGRSAWRRRLLVLAGLLGLVAVSVLRMPEGLQPLQAAHAADLRPATAWLVALTGTAPLAWLLAPIHLVLGPFLALDGRAFLLALGPALAVVSLHYLWVVRSAVAFEDDAVDQAQQRAARHAAWRRGGMPGTAPARARPGPFPLAPDGPPEIAFLWKNLLSTWPYFTLRVLGIAAAVVAAVCLWLRLQPSLRPLLAVAGSTAVVCAGYTLIIGPQFARQDLRSDLAHADILKTYPLPGWRLLLGELLTPIAILTGVVWLALLAAALVFPTPRASAGWLTPEVRVVAALGLAVVTPAVVALQLLVPNAAALLFPAWFQATRTHGGGPEVVGQRMIFFFAQVLAMVLALAPPLALAGLLLFIGQWLVGLAAAVGLASVALLLVLLGEVWCGVWLLGQRFDRLDLSAELPPGD
jgi:ABC-2 type transport system permease protein